MGRWFPLIKNLQLGAISNGILDKSLLGLDDFMDMDLCDFGLASPKVFE
jgi:hypothetical protein